MTNTLKWRLGKLPTPMEVTSLVNDKLITKEEAREILFTEESKTERDEKSLEEEIKFLRELVEKLSDNKQDRIIEVIKTVQVPYIQYPWYQPYQYWCGAIGNGGGSIISAGSVSVSNVGSNTLSSSSSYQNSAFSNIQTF